jgi:SecD/SecF fusion protein
MYLAGNFLPADIVQSEVVGPSLDKKHWQWNYICIVGLLLVSLWMLVYYGKAGWYANIALAVTYFSCSNPSLGAVLTLPGSW